jgi:hypothetical protein
MVGLFVKTNKNGFCSSCSRRKDKNYLLKEDALPVWYKTKEDAKRKHNPQYHVPHELKDLEMAECLLIQRLSPVVPLYHIKNGTMGLTGHTCAFEQDVKGFANRLPRGQDDVSIIKILRSMKTEIGNNSASKIKPYKVRRYKVIKALEWLQKHNPEYHDIEIDASQLDWMNGNVDYIGGTVIESEEELLTAQDDTAENADIGPAPNQAAAPLEGDNIKEFAYIDTKGTGKISADDARINNVLRNAARSSPKAHEIAMEWPKEAMTPVCEYTTRVFVNAFPWLFPGGIGDVKDFPSGPKTGPGKQVENVQTSPEGQICPRR